MKYTVDSINPDWSKYKYYPHLSASEDLLKGGWILHLMAPGSTDRFKDYLRCQSVDTRFARTMELTSQSWSSYTPKYENWYGLQFPMLNIDVVSMYGGGIEYDDLPTDIRQVCNLAEKHLLMDQIFEQFVYDKTGRFKNEWDAIQNKERGILLIEFNGAMRAEKL